MVEMIARSAGGAQFFLRNQPVPALVSALTFTLLILPHLGNRFGQVSAEEGPFSSPVGNGNGMTLGFGHSIWRNLVTFMGGGSG
jgi:hypothetical protein